MAGLLIAALAVLSTGRQAPTVSFTCRAEPLSRLVSELGVATHMNLSVAQACANDVLVVSANGVSPKDLLDEIAKVDSGEWKPSGDGYIFGPDPAARQAEERHETAHQGNLIHAAILKKLADAEKAAKATAGSDSENFTMAMPFGMGGGPGQVSVLQLLKSLDPPSLVVDEMHRAVFSSNPNSMQLPLGAGSDAIIGQLIAEHNKSVPKDADASKQLPPGLDEKSMGFIKDMVEQAMKPISGYSKADLVVAPMPFLGGTTASLVLYDTKGKVLLTATASLDTGFLDAIISAAMGKQAATSSTTPIELSPETQAYEQFTTGGQGIMGASQMTSRPIPALLKPFLADPRAHDPLSLLPSDELFALAKSAKKPLVAVVPDSAMSVTAMVMNSKPSIEEFVSELNAGKSMVMAEQNGWIEVKPVAPEGARRNRTDRGALAKLLHAARAKHVASLDDIAEFAQNSPSPMSGGVTQTYLSLFVPGAISGGLDGITNWDMVRIYGQISPDQRATLVSGSRMPLNSLSSAQQGFLNEMVFGPLAQLEVGDPAKSGKDVMTQMMSMFMGGHDYTDEPTELLPSGIPGGGAFQMTAEQEPFLIPVAAGGQDGISQMMGMSEMAMLKFFSEQPAFAQASGMMPNFDKMKVGHRVVYHLTFHLTSGIRLTGTLTDNSLADDAQVVSANDLPQDMQDLIAKKVEEFKKSPLGSLAALGALAGNGAGAPPP